MTLETEFWLNLPLSCSIGIFTEVDCRVRVEFETDGVSLDGGFTVLAVQPEGLKGWLTKDHPDFGMFKAGVLAKEELTRKKYGQGTVTAECLSAIADCLWPDPDAARDRMTERELDGVYA